MIRAIFLVLAALISVEAFSGDLKSKEDINSLVSEVMALAAAGRSADGLSLLKPYLMIPPAEFDESLEQLKLKEPKMEQRFGKIVGAELLDLKEVGESLMLAVFIQKFEKHVMQWRLYFYRPADKWILNTYRTDDKISNLFAE